MQAKVTINKVLKGAASKKAAPKKAAVAAPKKSSVNTKMLVCAPDDKCFWTTDGQILKNLEELKLAFGTMDDKVFLHHVTKEKNDFADWVEQVLGDVECAKALRKSKKPASAKTVMSKCLRAYNI